jgi:hypothetical protein
VSQDNTHITTSIASFEENGESKEIVPNSGRCWNSEGDDERAEQCQRFG